MLDVSVFSTFLFPCSGILDYLLAGSLQLCFLTLLQSLYFLGFMQLHLACTWILFSCCFEESLRHYIMRQDVALGIKWLVDFGILENMYFCFCIQISIDKYRWSCCKDIQKPVCLLDYSFDQINGKVSKLAFTASLCSAKLAFLSFSCQVSSILYLWTNSLSLPTFPSCLFAVHLTVLPHFILKWTHSRKSLHSPPQIFDWSMDSSYRLSRIIQSINTM